MMTPRVLKMAKYGISLGLLAWLIGRTEVTNVAGLIATSDRGALVIALGAYLASVVVAAYRWRLLLIARQVPLPLFRALSLYFIGNFFGNFLPTSIGGDAVRAYGASVDLGQRADAFASVFIERFVGLFAVVTLALVGLLAMALHLEQTYMLPVTVVLFLLLLATFPVLFSRWWVVRMKRLFERITVFNVGGRAARLHEVLYQYGGHRGALVGNFFLSILYQGLIIVMNVYVAKGLRLPIHALYFVAFVPIIAVISMFPFSINALGVREGGYVVLFAQVGHPAEAALALSLTLYGLAVLSSLPGGLLFAVQGGRRLPSLHRAPYPIEGVTKGES